MKYPKKEETLLSYNDIVPPNDKDLEDAVLGMILVDPDSIYRVANQLKTELFFYDENQKVCELIIQLYNERKPIDILTVTQKSFENNYNAIASPYFISTLTNKISGTTNLDYYLLLLQQYALKRLMIQSCSKGIRGGYDKTIDVFDLVAEIQTDIENSIKGIANYDVESVGKIHSEIIQKSIELTRSDRKSGVPTGLNLVDNVTNGWQNSDLIILAGRPSMGKTAAAISMALHPALYEDIGVGIFSLEMSSEQLVSRMQSIMSGVNVGRIVKKQLDLDEIEKIDMLARKLNKAPIYIDDTPNISLQDFRGKARKMVKELGCRLIIVDYLQLMRSGLKTFSREHEIAEISKALKAVAKELNIPVLALSQLSRAVESRGGDKKPLLSDLRESGQIEQDADMVCFCYRPEYYEINDYQLGNEHYDTNGLFLLLVSKHRNGELGEIPLRFIHEQTKLANYSKSNFDPIEDRFETDIKNSTFVQQVEQVEKLDQEDFIDNSGEKITGWDRDLFNDETPF
jgi:replicative DNA helicase